MKFSSELDPACAEPHISIKFSERTEDIQSLEKLILDFLSQQEKIIGIKENIEFFLSPKEILFFQTEDNSIYAHTEQDSYLTKHKLYELDSKLPSFFQRVSKSTIVNINKIVASKRELNGSAILHFNHSSKMVYCSRSYYHDLRAKLISK